MDWLITSDCRKKRGVENRSPPPSVFHLYSRHKAPAWHLKMEWKIRIGLIKMTCLFIGSEFRFSVKRQGYIFSATFLWVAQNLDELWGVKWSLPNITAGGAGLNIDFIGWFWFWTFKKIDLFCFQSIVSRLTRLKIFIEIFYILCPCYFDNKYCWNDDMFLKQIDTCSKNLKK